MPPRGMSAEVRTVDDRRASRPPSPVPFRGKTGGCPDWTRSHTSHRAPIALTDPHPSPSTHAGQAQDGAAPVPRVLQAVAPEGRGEGGGEEGGGVPGGEGRGAVAHRRLLGARGQDRHSKLVLVLPRRGERQAAARGGDGGRAHRRARGGVRTAGRTAREGGGGVPPDGGAADGGGDAAFGDGGEREAQEGARVVRERGRGGAGDDPGR